MAFVKKQSVSTDILQEKTSEGVVAGDSKSVLTPFQMTVGKTTTAV